MPDLLTTDEAASYLRLSERKLYELVANGAVPCTKVTGKWLFPKAALDRWLAAGLARAGGARACAGAADRRRQPRSAAGMGAARERLRARQPARRQRSRLAAARARRGDGGGDPSAPARRRRRGRQYRRGRACVGAARRGGDRALRAASRGWWSRPAIRCGSPTSPASRRGARGWRCGPPGAGAQLLLLALLARAGLALDALAVVKPACPTGPDIAQAVRSGRADCGIATRAVAQAAGLDFVPLTWERFDLVLRQRGYFLPGRRRCSGFIRTAAFPRARRRARRLRRERGGRGASGQLSSTAQVSSMAGRCVPQSGPAIARVVSASRG